MEHGKASSAALAAGLLLLLAPLSATPQDKPKESAKPPDHGSPEVKTETYKDEKGAPRWTCEVRTFKLGMVNPHGITPVISPDLRHFAVGDPECKFVVLDGKEGKKYYEIESFAFSPDSRRTAYGVEEHGRTSDDIRHFVVLDGVEGTRHQGVVAMGNIVFSPDGKRVAYLLDTLSDGQTIVLDGKESSHHQEIDNESMVFSSDSQHFAYGAKDGEKRGVYRDDKKLDEFDELLPSRARIQFSPDSAKLAYGFLKGDQWSLAYGDRRCALFKKSDFGNFEGAPPVLSADSKRFAFPVRRGEQWFLVCESAEYGPYQSVKDQSMQDVRVAFSPDSARFAHSALLGKKAQVFLDGKPTQTFDVDEDLSGVNTTRLLFSPDSRQFAVIGRRGDHEELWVDGKKVKESGSILGVKYSPDSKRMAVALPGRVVEGRTEGKTYEGIWGDSLSFSPDSKHLTFWAGVGNQSVFVIDGVETFRAMNEGLYTYVGVIGWNSVVFLENHHIGTLIWYWSDVAVGKSIAEDGAPFDIEKTGSYIHLALLDFAEAGK